MVYAAHGLSSAIAYTPGSITSRVIVKTDRLNVTLFCMAAGTDIDEHTAAREGTVHVLEGKGTFTLDGKTVPMRPGTLIHLKVKQPHSLEAEEDTAFLLTLA